MYLNFFICKFHSSATSITPCKILRKFTVVQSSVIKCFHAVNFRQSYKPRTRSESTSTLQVVCLFCSVSSELGPAAAGRSAARVAHSAVTDSSEEPTLAEGAVITARIVAWRFTACPQGNAVSRRRRALLHTEFVLREREKQKQHMRSCCFTVCCCGLKSKQRQDLKTEKWLKGEKNAENM